MGDQLTQPDRNSSVIRWLLLTVGHDALRCLVLAVLMFCTGCAPFVQQEIQKYQTLVASSRHDTETAKKKHRQAVAIMETAVLPHGYAKAERLLGDALVADVTYGPAHNSLGSLYYMQNKLYLAAWEFEYAAKLMPDLAEPLNNLGLVYERVGKYEQAISYYSMALSREANDPEVMGNLVRSRMLTGDRSGDLKHMISDLALSHPESNWQRWARDSVELTKFDDMESSLPASWRMPDKAPEDLPAPVRDEDLKPPAFNPLRLPQPPPPTGAVPDLAPPGRARYQ